MAKVKKSKKKQEMENILMKYFLEQMKTSVQMTETVDAETVKGICEHAKAANEETAKRAERETNQMKTLLIGFEKQQEEIAGLKKELIHANKKIKSLKSDAEKYRNRNAVLSNQILELDHEIGYLKKNAKKQKAETKQLTVIAKSMGSILRICKMSDSLGKAKNKFLDASGEAKAFRKKNNYLFGDTLKIIDGEYREVSK